MNFSDKLREARTQKGFTQKQVADFLNISRSAYSYYESGKSEPSLDKISKLIFLLEISADEIIKSSSL